MVSTAKIISVLDDFSYTEVTTSGGEALSSKNVHIDPNVPMKTCYGSESGPDGQEASKTTTVSTAGASTPKSFGGDEPNTIGRSEDEEDSEEDDEDSEEDDDNQKSEEEGEEHPHGHLHRQDAFQMTRKESILSTFKETVLSKTEYLSRASRRFSRFTKSFFPRRTLHSCVTIAPENKIGTICFGDVALIGLALQKGFKISYCRAIEDEVPADTSKRKYLFKEDDIFHTYEFIFTDYSPADFRRIRRATSRKNPNCEEEKYFNSLVLPDQVFKTTLSIVKSPSGKSPAMFFLSHNEHFFLKQLSKKEVNFAIGMLREYVEYIETNNDSLLPRLYGIYSIEIRKSRYKKMKRYFLCMNNFYAVHHKISLKYDLKGSTYKRWASEKEKKKKHPVFKDNDWRASGLSVPLPSTTCQILQRDSQFLASHMAIDYSLLLGVHVKDLDNMNHITGMREGNIITMSVETDSHIFYFGIVDIFARYTPIKRLETLLRGRGYRDISCQHPTKYHSRFSKMISGMDKNR